MAEVTSGDVTVIVLTTEEADALGALLMWATTDESGRPTVDEGPLHELIEEMYPTWTEDDDVLAQDGQVKPDAWKGRR